jgi:hypothetical protein
MTPDGTRLPTESEIEPWFRAVVDLWDDRATYDALGSHGRAIAVARYSEPVARARHLEYFTSLQPRATPFDIDPAATP